jgi:hypothetical protein
MTTDPKPTSQQETQTSLQVGDAELSLREQTFRLAGREPVQLTPTEFCLLEYLMRHEGIPISGKTLADISDTKLLHLILFWIPPLREKIEPDPYTPAYLHTVPGIGYLFQSPASPEFPLAFEQKIALLEKRLDTLESDLADTTPDDSLFTDLRLLLYYTKRLHELYRKLSDTVYSFPDMAEKEGEKQPEAQPATERKIGVPAPKLPAEQQETEAPARPQRRAKRPAWQQLIFEAAPPVIISPPPLTTGIAYEITRTIEKQRRNVEYSRRWRQRHPEKARQYTRKWQQTPQGREYFKNYMRRKRAK